MLRVMGRNRAYRPYRSKRDQPTRGELRKQCEEARLDLRALYRALDRRLLLVDLPSELQELMELDGDLAEALWVLDQPRNRFDMKAMQRDTLASLAKIPDARERVLMLLTVPEREAVLTELPNVRSSLLPTDAYLEVPGRDPLV